jgi:hypothetical protein
MAGAGNRRSYLLYTLSDLNGLWKEIIIYVNVLGFSYIKKERKKEYFIVIFYLFQVQTS